MVSKAVTVAGGMTPLVAATGTILQEYLGLNVIYTLQKKKPTEKGWMCKLYK